MKKSSVLIALSGGVDSAVCALLLKEQGLDVHAIYLNLTNTDFSCRSAEAAGNIAGHLNIPFNVLDVKERFHREVVGYFLQNYSTGLTPNPCIICNAKVKFQCVMEEALKRDIFCIATGHYARVVNRQEQILLFKGLDRAKDQSYFLAMLPGSILCHLLLPLGSMSKSQVRDMAKRAGIHDIILPESQEICFLKGDYREFLLSAMPDLNSPGDIVDVKGNVLGRHSGLYGYTVGQRRGIGIPAKAPLYVVGLDVASNRLIVGSNDDLFFTRFIVDSLNWLDRDIDVNEGIFNVKIRFRHAGQEATVKNISDDKLLIEFKEPQRAITPGQFAVVYSGEQVIVGGRICRLPSIHWAVR